FNSQLPPQLCAKSQLFAFLLPRVVFSTTCQDAIIRTFLVQVFVIFANQQVLGYYQMIPIAVFAAMKTVA
ncbi:MAG: hypothetical protein ACKO5E_18845, partial [bacterium]